MRPSPSSCAGRCSASRARPRPARRAGLPAALGGTPATAQLVLAAFVAGRVACSCSASWARASISRAAGAVAFRLCRGVRRRGQAGSLDAAHRACASCRARRAAAAVFAPGFIRAGFEPNGRARARPAGQHRIHRSGAGAGRRPLAAALVGLAGLVRRHRHPRLRPRGPDRGAARPFPEARARDAHAAAMACCCAISSSCASALSQAFTLGGLLTFVFGAPGGDHCLAGRTLTDFMMMQISGILFFAVSANYGGPARRRFGTERMILFGSAALRRGRARHPRLCAGRRRLAADAGDPVRAGESRPRPARPARLHAGGDRRAWRRCPRRGSGHPLHPADAAGGTAAAAPFISVGLACARGLRGRDLGRVGPVPAAAEASPQAGSSSAGTVSSIQPPPSTRSPS